MKNTVRPGDVIVTVVPDAQQDKLRPAVVVATENYLSRCPDVMFALITSQFKKADTEFDTPLYDWREAKLKLPSTVRSQIHTKPQSDVVRIGRLSAADWKDVQTRLRLALEL